MRSFSVIGLGTFGHGLARALSRLGAKVIAVDNLHANVDRVKEDVHTAVVMDARDRGALEDLRVHDVDCAVVCMAEDFEASEICAVHLIDLGCPHVLVRGTNRERVEILEALGPHVITPGLRSAGQWAVRLAAPGLSDYATLAGEQDVALVMVTDSMAVGSLGDLKLKPDVLALRRGEEVFVGPGHAQALKPGDELILFGKEQDLIGASDMFVERS